ncbi:MAG TPA: DNA polymerase, partial [Acidimicrobiales bacterium]|nr:DNA polymerase [Acidimicrobiales bacterium]
ADYNQIELRILAHLSGDRGLLEAFASRSDVHTTTAARIFGVEPARVTSAQRAKAKMVSYGLAYGMEAFGLATRLGIAVDEAAGILNAFFANFPDVKAYMEDTISQARTDGYTVTEFGRRRPIPELRSPNFRIRQQGERQAMNAGIQGLAADLFKMALVSLSRSLHETGVKARIVLQVHDEIIVEAPPGEQSSVEEFTRRAMEGTHQLQVPLEVEMAWGTTWAEAKH